MSPLALVTLVRRWMPLIMLLLLTLRWLGAPQTRRHCVTNSACGKDVLRKERSTAHRFWSRNLIMVVPVLRFLKA